MHSKAPHWFTDSAGALLWALAAAMFISIVAGDGWVTPRDPLFKVSMAAVFWAVGTADLVVGLVCLFSKQAWLKVTLILWLAINFLAYQLGLSWFVGPHSFGGYWGNLAAAFHVTPGTAYWTSVLVYVYLLSGSVVSLLWPLWHNLKKDAEGYFKMSCPNCGGHIEFPVHGIGLGIACPHCAAAITLQGPA